MPKPMKKPAAKSAKPVKKTAAAKPAKKVAKPAAKAKPVKKVAKATKPTKTAKPAAKSSKPAKKVVAPKKVVKSSKAKPARRAKVEAPEVKPIRTALNKTGLVAHLVETSGVEKKPVLAVLGALENTIAAHLHPKGAGEFMMSGLFKIVTKKIPAQKGGVKKPNPFKPGEMMVTKAKPATVRVKVRPLVKLKGFALA